MKTQGFEQKLLAECDKEPIHIPGSIQPFGVLLTIDPVTLEIQNISESCAAFWGLPYQALLGNHLSEFMLGDDVQALKSYLQRPNLKEQRPLHLKLPFTGAERYESWELTAHEHEGVFFLEIEPVDTNRALSSSSIFHLQIQDAVKALQGAKSLQDLCEVAAMQVKSLTGYDRVMIYRFDTDWHGEVVAEVCEPHVDAYLGHHFPASDIPVQAREIFKHNWLRMIPDINYRPSTIQPGKHPATGASLNLSRSTLRSVSPIHLQYLENMDVFASLTVSLMDEGKLWGLITCHHTSPRLINSDARSSAQLIGQIVSSQLRTKETFDELEYRTLLSNTRTFLHQKMSDEDTLAHGLVKHSPNVLDLVNATGAAISNDNEWILIGQTPSPHQIENIVTWLLEHYSDNSLFSTNNLAAHLPEAMSYKEVASGLLAILIAKTKRNYVLWFRPEQITTRTWAGEPNKLVVESDGIHTYHPRKSFRSWKEIVKEKAAPWKRAEVEAADGLRIDILALALQREFEKEQLARKKAEKLSREKEEMVMMVSHDLRTPLNVAAMSFDFLQRVKPSEEPSVIRMVDRGARATKTMERLITDILDVTKIESGSLTLDFRAENARELMLEVVEFCAPLALERNITLDIEAVPALTHIHCERGRVSQVLDNLIGNALKFTPSGGMVTVSATEAGDFVQFTVKDTGPGIPSENLERIFNRFWQAEQTKRLGTGLGLSIAKGIVEHHKGAIWAESILGQGASFHFTIPIQRSDSVSKQMQ